MKIVKVFKWQKKDSVALSTYCAELCIDNFEKIYPEDKRPRQAIEAAKLWLEGKISDKDLEAAAESAAWSAESAAFDKIINKISLWMKNRIKELEKI